MLKVGDKVRLLEFPKETYPNFVDEMRQHVNKICTIRTIKPVYGFGSYSEDKHHLTFKEIYYNWSYDHVKLIDPQEIVLRILINNTNILTQTINKYKK